MRIGSSGTQSRCHANRWPNPRGKAPLHSHIDRGQSRHRTGAGRGSPQLKGATMSAVPTIHRFPVEHEGALVNAYLVETASGVVAVDGLLHVSAAREMRAGIDRLGKPLLAALLTHSHP